MTTLADIMADIADDVDDTSGEYGNQIMKAVQAAQRFCEGTTYYFNETRDVTFPTVPAQEWYDDNDSPHIPTLIRIQALWKEDAQGQRTCLERVTPEEIESVSDNAASHGEPYSWTYFNQKIRLYPIPDTQPFTIRMQLGPYRLMPLVDATDTNAWLTEAYDLIKARAKYILHKNTLLEPTLAAEALNDWRDWDARLAGETTMRIGTGTICPTCW